MEELIACGADISVQSVDQQTPLSVAKNTSVIAVLQRELVTQLKVKRSNLLNGKMNTLMDSRSSALNVSQDFVTSLSVPPNTSAGRSGALPSADNHDDVVLQLHELKAKRWAYSQSPLTWAAEGGMTGAIDQMLAQGVDSNEADISGRSTLHACAHLVSQATDTQALLPLRQMIESILNSGGDVNAKSISGKTPLHELFAKNENPAFQKVNPQEKVLLGRLRAVVARTLLQWGADPLAPDRQGSTPLHYSAKENMAACLVEMLKAKGVNIYCRDPRGRTLLHTACVFGSEAVASIVVNYDADFATGIQCVLDRDGKTAQHLLSPHMSSTSLTSLWQACRLGNVSR